MEKKNYFKFLLNNQRGLVLLSTLTLQTILGIVALMTGLGIHLQQGDQINEKLKFINSDSLIRIINFCSKHLSNYNSESCEGVLSDNPDLTKGLQEFYFKILEAPEVNSQLILTQVVIKKEASSGEAGEVKLSLYELMGNWRYGNVAARRASYENLNGMTLNQLLGSPVSKDPKKRASDLEKLNYGALADLAYRTMIFNKYGPQ
ncbi:MAG: hypothetical protein K1X29_08900 [Bdellovibrionales bacterium]|nr:hypothetical protein [Bdellovibrionales bacterium]